jgi:ABC-type glycerol-3-phosphate transport system substrate-binding protein
MSHAASPTRRRFLRSALHLGALLTARRAPAAPRGVRLTHWDSNPNPRRTRAYKLAAERFASLHPGVTIDYVPIGIDDYVAKVLAAHDAGSPPDIIDIWPSWAARLVAANALHDLEPALAEWPRRADFVSANLRLSRVIGGRARFQILDLFLQGTHYRRDLTALAGLADPRALDLGGRWNGDAFVRTARALHRPQNGVYGVALRGGQGADLTLFNLMFSTTRGRWFDETGRCLLDSKAAVDALAWYASLATELLLCQPTAAADGYQEFMGLFYRGSAGLALHGDDGLNALHELGRTRYGSARLPALTDAGVHMALAGFGPAVMARSREPEVAARFACFFVEQYSQLYLDAAAASSQESVVVGAPMNSDLCRPQTADPLYTPFFRETLGDESRLFLPPYELADYDRIVREVVEAGFRAVLRRQLTPAEAARRWAKAFTMAHRKG